MLTCVFLASHYQTLLYIHFHIFTDVNMDRKYFLHLFIFPQYMKMMGVNPLSHFFAWFLECAAYLLFTIFIITLVLKYGRILPNSDGFLLFLYLCDYGLSVLAFSYLVSSFFDKTYIAGLSGSLLYILSFFPFIMVLALETNLTLPQKSALVIHFVNLLDQQSCISNYCDMTYTHE